MPGHFGSSPGVHPTDYGPHGMHRPGTQTWNTQLCCPAGMDCALCAAATFLPCCVVGSLTKMMRNPGTLADPCSYDGGGETACAITCLLFAANSALQALVSGLPPGAVQIHACYTHQVRKEIRETYDIEGHPCTDLVCHWCCMPCALCQEHVEVTRRVQGHYLAQQAGVVFYPQHMMPVMPPVMGHPVIGQPAPGNPYANQGNPYPAPASAYPSPPGATQAYPPQTQRIPDV